MKSGMIDGRRGSLLTSSVLFLAFAVLIDTSTYGQAYELAPAQFTAKQVNETLSIRESTIQTPVFEEDPFMGTVTTTVLIEGQPWTLQLQRHTLRSDDFRLLVQYEENGPLVRVEPAQIRTLKGSVAEHPQATVRGSLHDGRFDGVITTEDEAYVIQSLQNLGLDAPFGEHVVYKDSDWFDDVNHRCGVTAEMEQRALGRVNADGGVAGTGLKITDLGVDADFEFYVLNGSNVNNTLADMENIVNIMESRYEVATIGVTYEITTAIVRTVSGAPYTSTDYGTLLDQFRSHWSSSPQSQIRRDIAELFTGKDISISPNFVIGVAWLAAVCDTPSGLGYSVVESRFTSSINSRAALSAHEIGHNYSASHCNGCSGCTNCCRIMCSGLGGCSGIITSFGCTEETAIVNHKNSSSCLSDLADPLPLPFFDDIPSGTLSASLWSYINGATSSTNASNETSSPNSINLDAAGSGTYQDDEIRTNFIQFAGQTQGTVTYFTQHSGVESGEQLVVEYFGTNNLWNELNRVTSTGINQSTFTSQSHSLPANAFHNEFRLRFRAEVNETNDEWFIDNVQIAAIAPAVVTQQPASLTVCQGASAAFTVQAGGSTPITYQWQKDNVNIGGATSPTLTINPANPANAGSYTCVVSNAQGSSESDPATLTVLTNATCNDGMFCNGVESCAAGACVDNADPCAEACKESNDTCQPFGTMSCELVTTSAPAGGTVDLELYLSQVLDLVGYQAQIAITPLTGTGTVSVACPDGAFIDNGRPDYVFAGETSFAALDCDNRSIASAVFNPVEVPVSPKYLATYTLEISPGADEGSTFQISLVNNPTQTFLREGLEQPIPFDIGAPCILTVSNCASVFGDVKTPLDGIVNIDDILCVLAGFSNFSNCPLGDLQPCFGNGVISLDDILWVLAAFGGVDHCCGGGGGASGGNDSATSTEREVPSSRPIQRTTVSTTTETRLWLESRVDGDTTYFDTFIDDVADLHGYQVAIDVTDARGKRVTLSQVNVDTDRPEFIFAGHEPFVAHDLKGGRLAAATLTDGVSTVAPRHLGTFAVSTRELRSTGIDIKAQIRHSETMLRDTNGNEVEWQIRDAVVVDAPSSTRHRAGQNN